MRNDCDSHWHDYFFRRRTLHVRRRDAVVTFGGTQAGHPLCFAVPAEEGEILQFVLQFVHEIQDGRRAFRGGQIEIEAEFEITSRDRAAFQFQEVQAERREFRDDGIQRARTMRQRHDQTDAAGARQNRQVLRNADETRVVVAVVLYAFLQRLQIVETAAVMAADGGEIAAAGGRD